LQVYLLEPIEIAFGPSHVEVEVNGVLIVNVRLSGRLPSAGANSRVDFTDCRQVPFHSAIADGLVFAIDTRMLFVF
jgi:hypothetical protein